MSDAAAKCLTPRDAETTTERDATGKIAVCLTHGGGLSYRCVRTPARSRRADFMRRARWRIMRRAPARTSARAGR